MTQMKPKKSNFALGQKDQNEDHDLMWGIIDFHILNTTHQTQPNHWIN